MALGTLLAMIASLVLREALIGLSDRLSLAPHAPATLYLWGSVPDVTLAPARQVRGLCVGFFASLSTAAVFLLIFARLSGPATPLAVTGVALVLVLFNLLVAAVTLLPFYPLPGGRLLVAVIAGKSGRAAATRWAGALCLAGSVLLLATGFWRGWGGAPLTALTMIVMAIHFALAGITHARKDSS